jgi:hypothetical protein
MSIRIKYSGCGETIKAADKLAGQHVACRGWSCSWVKRPELPSAVARQCYWSLSRGTGHVVSASGHWAPSMGSAHWASALVYAALQLGELQGLARRRGSACR